MHLPASALPGAPSLLLDPVAQAILGQVFGRRAAPWNPGDAFVREALANKTIDLTNNTLIATSAQIAAAVTDETGTGALVFASSPALAGTPTAPTAAAGTNTTQIATTAHVFAERSNASTLTNKTIDLANNTLSATSAQLAAALTDETGSGAAVFATSPTLTTPKATTTFGVGNATPAASGAGISFPATQSASTDANTLDDYEEGTFTPTLSGSFTYSIQSGTYTKIGRLCTVHILIAWSANASASTNFRVQSLPFACGSLRACGSLGYLSGVDNQGGKQLVIFMSSGNTFVEWYAINDNAGAGAIDANLCSASGEVQLTISYEV